MNVGDTTFQPYNDEDPDKVYVRVRTSVLRWARQNNRVFTADKTDTGILIQRIK